MYEVLFERKGLSLERLYALVLLNERGSLIKAANGDMGLQSRYSHYLRELSAFIGTPLTKKDGRSIRLTAAGEELANLARAQFRSLIELRGRAAQAAQQVAIGAGDSILQWLLIPAIGMIRRPGKSRAVRIENLRTTDLVRRLQEQRLDFAVVRKNAVPEGLKCADICIVRYVIVVPRRIAPRRMKLETALLGCPHVTVAGDGELVKKLRTLAQDLGGTFQPEIVCDSIGQCLAAVKTGSYAAVLPTQVMEGAGELDCEVVDEEELADLNRPIVLAWSPRNLESLGEQIERFRAELLSALVDVAKPRWNAAGGNLLPFD
jgi:DNA-binding transcriptional LysR family regulator